MEVWHLPLMEESTNGIEVLKIELPNPNLLPQLIVVTQQNFNSIELFHNVFLHTNTLVCDFKQQLGRFTQRKLDCVVSYWLTTTSKWSPIFISSICWWQRLSLGTNPYTHIKNINFTSNLKLGQAPFIRFGYGLKIPRQCCQHMKLES